jgi:hypothetical protein
MFGVVAIFKEIQPLVAQEIVKRFRIRQTMPVRVVIYADNHVIDHIALLVRHYHFLDFDAIPNAAMATFSSPPTHAGNLYAAPFYRQDEVIIPH